MHSSSPTQHFYSLFGLTIASEIELPGLELADRQLVPDVAIVIGEGEVGAFELLIEEVATYRIARGAHIAVQPDANGDPRDVRLFLLGSAMGILLHQRGMLPLHANAVVVENEAVAFMGRSGVGKSTLAAWFFDEGHTVLADDVCVIEFDKNGCPTALPGQPRLRLWNDALEASGRRADEHPLSFSWANEYEQKFDVSMGSQEAVRPVPLGAIYLIADGDKLGVERIDGAEAAEALIVNTYRGQMIEKVGDTADHFRACAHLAQKVTIYRLSRPWVEGDKTELFEQIKDLIKSQSVSKP